MKRQRFLPACLMATTLVTALRAESIAVTHIQRPMHQFMVARSEDGKTIASGEFSQVVQGKEVTMRITYRFVDGSIDDETTTYTQQGTFRLVRNHHIQRGPFFTKPTDLTVETATGIVTSRTMDKNGTIRVDSKHIALPDDLSNGMIGTLLLNVSRNKVPFRIGMLAPVGGGRLVRVLISPQDEQTIQLVGHSLKATVFRIHPELGGIVSMIARLIGLQPKDVVVWVLEGDEPAVLVVLGQLGGYGPVVSSDLIGDSLGK
jgi:hypothetical protein